VVIKLTLDTNCIVIIGRDVKKEYYRQILALEELAKKGLVQIFKTDVQDTEIGRHRDQANPPQRMLERLEKSATVEEQIGIGVWGYSRWGHFVWAGPEDSEELDRLRKTVPDMGDAMVIMTHRKHGNDYLVTDNVKHFRTTGGIKVVDPKKLSTKKLEYISSEEQLDVYLNKLVE
jgi:hypothetical protein